MYTGTCLCGTVQYEVDGPFAMMANCHCSMCRKHHGAMFSTFASAPATGFRWTSGQDNIETYRSSEHGRRPFCRTCGSVAPMLLPDMNLVFVPAGNLQGDPGLKPQMHMFAASRAAWYPITDGLPQHDGYPPQFGGGTGIDRPRPPPNATNAFYRHQQLAWVRGESDVRTYSLPGAKYFAQSFCSHCGSPVPRVNAATGRVVVPCGGLDDDPGARPLGNIFATSKAPWFEITDGLPQWEAYPARS
jgi:hypothetical protein